MTSVSNLDSLQWKDSTVQADFTFRPDDRKLIRVICEDVEIFRVLDEMPLSTENDTPNDGLVREHFAYRVEGARFFLSQSEALFLTVKSLHHYQFITGWTCLDIISKNQPIITIETRKADS